MAHVVGACENCLHRKGNECDVIREPAYLWRRGRKCWAYTEDAHALLRRYRDIYRHYASVEPVPASVRRKYNAEVKRLMGIIRGKGDERENLGGKV